MSIYSTIKDLYPELEFQELEGFDDAVIGLEIEQIRLVYSVGSILEILQQKMSRVEACSKFELVIRQTKFEGVAPLFVDDDY
jgi:hypothetical protein